MNIWISNSYIEDFSLIRTMSVAPIAHAVSDERVALQQGQNVLAKFFAIAGGIFHVHAVQIVEAACRDAVAQQLRHQAARQQNLNAPIFRCHVSTVNKLICAVNHAQTRSFHPTCFLAYQTNWQ